MTCGCQDLQQRYCRNRLRQHLCQCFNRRQPYTQPGKRSWAGHDCKSADVPFAESVLPEQGRSLRNQRGGECPSRKWGRLDDVASIVRHASREGDAALLARSVDRKKKHEIEVARNAGGGLSQWPPSTNSSSTPPALAGCTKTYRCPPAPILISFETNLTPSFFRRSTAAARSGTRRQ